MFLGEVVPRRSPVSIALGAPNLRTQGENMARAADGNNDTAAAVGGENLLQMDGNEKEKVPSFRELLEAELLAIGSTGTAEETVEESEVGTEMEKDVDATTQFGQKRRHSSTCIGAHASSDSPASADRSWTVDAPLADLLESDGAVSQMAPPGHRSKQVEVALKQLMLQYPNSDREMFRQRLEQGRDLEESKELIHVFMSFGNDQSSCPGASSSETLTQEQLESVDTVVKVFPEVDPQFVTRQIVERGVGALELSNAMAEDSSYPKRRHREDKERKVRLRNELLDPNKFDAEHFLRNFEQPDADAYFSDETRAVTKLYIKHAKVYLRARFPNMSRNLIYGELASHGNHLLPTLRALLHGIGYDCKFGAVGVSDAVPWPDQIDNSFFTELQFALHEMQIKVLVSQRNAEREQRLLEVRERGRLCECVSCANDQCLPEDMIECSNGHKFCRQCVQSHAETRIIESHHQVSCLQCDAEYLTEEIEAVTRPVIFNQLIDLRNKAEMRKIISDNNTESCPACDFAMQIENLDDKLFLCRNENCLTESCRLCHRPNHIPQRCDEVEGDTDTKMRTYIENAMAEAMIRVCPECHKRIVKDSGCNKLKCPCGAYMCYVCRELIPPQHHNDYSHFRMVVGEPAAQAACPLFTPVDVVHADVAEQAGNEARERFLAQNPQAQLQKEVKPENVQQLVERNIPDGDLRNMGFHERLMRLNQAAEAVPYHQQHYDVIRNARVLVVDGIRPEPRPPPLGQEALRRLIERRERALAAQRARTEAAAQEERDRAHRQPTMAQLQMRLEMELTERDNLEIRHEQRQRQMQRQRDEMLWEINRLTQMREEMQTEGEREQRAFVRVSLATNERIERLHNQIVAKELDREQEAVREGQAVAAEPAPKKQKVSRKKKKRSASKKQKSEPKEQEPSQRPPNADEDQPGPSHAELTPQTDEQNTTGVSEQTPGPSQAPEIAEAEEPVAESHNPEVAEQAPEPVNVEAVAEPMAVASYANDNDQLWLDSLLTDGEAEPDERHMLLEAVREVMPHATITDVDSGLQEQPEGLPKDERVRLIVSGLLDPIAQPQPRHSRIDGLYEDVKTMLPDATRADVIRALKELRKDGPLSGRPRDQLRHEVVKFIQDTQQANMLDVAQGGNSVSDDREP